MKKTRIFLITMFVLTFTLACSLTDLIPGDNQMEATAVALQATQVALDMKIMELQQQQTAAAQPPAEAESHSVPPPDGNEVIYEGIRFVYAPSIASGVDPVSKPSMEDIVGVIPEHIEFIFNGYAWNGSMHTPTIYIYSVDAYRSANEYSGEIIDELNILLQNRPAAPDTIPFLPIWNAGQMFHSNVEYMDFQNGSGVRFLTQYGQAIYPVNNNGLFYTFQGITNDGNWYVAAVLPVANPELPPNGEEPLNGDWEAFSNNFEAHLNEMAILLESQPDQAFNPNISALDDLIHSLQVK